MFRKKRLIAIIVAVVLLISVGAVALASGVNSDGGIKFDGGGGGVHNPECCPCKGKPPEGNPPCTCECHDPAKKCCPCYGQNPAGDCLTKPCECHEKRKYEKNLGSMHIDFGEQQISQGERIYKSLDDARFDAQGKTGADNRSPYRAAGFFVESLSPWRVELQISEFKVGTEDVIKGYEIKLIPGLFADASVGTRQGTTVWTGGNKGVSSNVVKPDLIVDGKDVLKAGATNKIIIATGEPGYNGGNFAGELKVPGGTAKPGEAKAIMTWTYHVGKSPG